MKRNTQNYFVLEPINVAIYFATTKVMNVIHLGCCVVVYLWGVGVWLVLKTWVAVLIGSSNQYKCNATE